MFSKPRRWFGRRRVTEMRRLSRKRRLQVERMEARRLLAVNVSQTGGTLLIEDDGAGFFDQLTITDSGGDLAIDHTTAPVNVSTGIAGSGSFGIFGATVPLAGVTDIVVNLGGGDDAVFFNSAFNPGSVNVTVDGQTGFDTVIWDSPNTVTSLDFTADRFQQNARSVTTGNQTWDGPVELTSNVNVSGANVTYTDTIDGGFALVGNAAVTFDGAVGASTALSRIDWFGDATVRGGAITTTGEQYFRTNVTLDAALNTTTLTSTSGGQVRLGQASSEEVRSAVDGGESLVINTSGLTWFDARIGAGGTQRLNSISTDAAGNTRASLEMQTTGNMTFADPVELRSGQASLLVAGGNLTFQDTVDGFGGSITAGGTVDFQAAVGNTTSLDRLTITAANVEIDDAFNIEGASGLSVDRQRFGDHRGERYRNQRSRGVDHRGTAGRVRQLFQLDHHRQR